MTSEKYSFFIDSLFQIDFLADTDAGSLIVQLSQTRGIAPRGVLGEVSVFSRDAGAPDFWIKDAVKLYEAVPYEIISEMSISRVRFLRTVYDLAKLVIKAEFRELELPEFDYAALKIYCHRDTFAWVEVEVIVTAYLDRIVQIQIKTGNNAAVEISEFADWKIGGPVPHFTYPFEQILV